MAVKKEECSLPIKDVISNVNSTLRDYKEMVSVARLPRDLSIQSLIIEPCLSLEQYIEVRFNYECYQFIPEFRYLLDQLEGKLFKCTRIEGENLVKHRYKTAVVEIIKFDEISCIDENAALELEKALKEVETLLGGTEIEFNNVQKKIRVTIK